ncbi:hypothetical protein LOY55_25910 [Pseudomonas sp. B21-040]|uniref:hypothetical protein n=1 Tax=unclassified Pseudomonas TaxID=196821 RepID=UPI001CBF84F8|nr:MULTISPECIES: hypothetical protein [unclassified Pseudomonas]UVL39620.1 hypothetical protein LOY55_25910 [Pseudomonas sp. B21-040]
MNEERSVRTLRFCFWYLKIPVVFKIAIASKLGSYKGWRDFLQEPSLLAMTASSHAQYDQTT